ncbi:hypothetical protein FRC17_009965 [Serendipita sp. 399]|nr:hypothetical protein FRC17_009965 [Serendipita sp. 399]
MDKLSDSFLKVSFEEVSTYDVSGEIKEKHNVYGDWKQQLSHTASDSGMAFTNILRERYKNHSVVRVGNPYMFPIMGYPDLVQQPIPQEDLDSLVVDFVPFARRSGHQGGIISEAVKLGGFVGAWKEYDFLIYHAIYPMGMFSEANFWLLHEGGSTPCYELLHAIGSWFQELHEEILVYDQGFWQKDAGLYQEIQKAEWKDVILKDKFKRAIQGDINDFFKNEAVYKELSIPWKPKHLEVLKLTLSVYGPAGNGKTISLKAAMHETEHPILYVRTLANWRGDEAAMADVFSMARRFSPCLLILEDLDSLINMRNQSFFLNQLDGLENNDGILLIGTTNHIERLDNSVANRPSRFDRKYLFDDPDVVERRLYCAYWQRKLKNNKKVSFPDTLADEVASTSDGFSFAYLKEAFVSTLILMAGDETLGFADTLRAQVKELKDQIRERPQQIQVQESATPSNSSGVSLELGPLRELLQRLSGGNEGTRGLTTKATIPSANGGLHPFTARLTASGLIARVPEEVTVETRTEIVVIQSVIGATEIETVNETETGVGRTETEIARVSAGIEMTINTVIDETRNVIVTMTVTRIEMTEVTGIARHETTAGSESRVGVERILVMEMNVVKNEDAKTETKVARRANAGGKNMTKRLAGVRGGTNPMILTGEDVTGTVPVMEKRLIVVLGGSFDFRAFRAYHLCRPISRPSPKYVPPPDDEEEETGDSEQRSVFVTQLAARMTARDLGYFFEDKLGDGAVRDARIVTDRISRRSKGIGYVEFRNIDLVSKAIALTGTVVMGLPIKIQLTEAERNRVHPGDLLNLPPGVSAPAGGPMQLYVGSLHFQLTEEEIRQVFEPFGELEFVDLHRDPITGRSKGYCFLQYRRPEDAKMALEQMDGFELAGRTLRVNTVHEKGVASSSGVGMSLRAMGNQAESLDEGGGNLNAVSRQALMQKLARTNEPQIPAPVAPPKLGIKSQETRCILLTNAFDPAEENDPDWDKALADDVVAECESRFQGRVEKITVERESKGEIYIQCDSVDMAKRAITNLNGRWFGGRQISASSMDYNLFVLKFLASLNGCFNENQPMLRTYIQLAPSYMIIDGSRKEDPEAGIAQWALGLDRIMDVLAALYPAGQLEYATVLAVRDALAECWSHTLSAHQAAQSAQDQIKTTAARLRKLTDDPDASSLTFRNQTIDFGFLS